MLKGILRDRQSKNSHEDSYRGETICLQLMPLTVYHERTFTGSWTHSYWGKTIRMHPSRLQQTLLACRKAKNSSTSSCKNPSFTHAFRLGKDLLFVKSRAAKKRSEKKAIYSLIWEFTMGKSPSSATSQTVTWASQLKATSPTIRDATQERDHTSARCAAISSWDQVP